MISFLYSLKAELMCLTSNPNNAFMIPLYEKDKTFLKKPLSSERRKLRTQSYLSSRGKASNIDGRGKGRSAVINHSKSFDAFLYPSFNADPNPFLAPSWITFM